MKFNNPSLIVVGTARLMDKPKAICSFNFSKLGA